MRAEETTLTKPAFLGLLLPYPLLGRDYRPRWGIFLAFGGPLLAGLLVFGFPPWPLEVWTLLLLTAGVQAFALKGAEQALRYAGRDGWIGALSYFVVAMLVLFSVLLLFRMYYSCPFLLLSFLLGLASLYLLSRWTPTARLALLPGGRVSWLRDRLKDRIVPVVTLEEAQGVVCDLKGLGPEAMMLLKEALARGVPIYHPVQVYEACTGRVPLELGLEEVFRAFSGWRPNPYYVLLKRALEILLVLLALPIAFVLGLGVAFLVYLDLGRPILFAQERVGLGGRPFKAYKFRTMRGAPQDGLYAGQEQHRITKIGWVLRRYRLDELPQLWNVLRGDMALIGPRPEQRVLVEKYREACFLYDLRHALPPGLTGWAQVQHGYAEGFEGALEKLGYDLYYLKNASLWLDLYILVRTFRVVLTGFGAR